MPPCYYCDGQFPTSFVYEGSALVAAGRYALFMSDCEAGGSTAAECQALWDAGGDGLCLLGGYGRTDASPWAGALNSDVTLGWDPYLADDDDWMPRYTATATAVIAGNTETITFVYKCVGSTEGLTTDSGSTWELDITTTAGTGVGIGTWTISEYSCGTNTVNLQGLDPSDPCYCVGVTMRAVDPQDLTLPDPYPDTLYMHWTSTTLGAGVEIPPGSGLVYQMCPPDLPNPIVLNRLLPVVPRFPAWESDCIPVCMAKDDFDNPPLFEGQDVPREPGQCYAKFRFECDQRSNVTTDNPTGWLLSGARRSSNDMYGSGFATVTTTVTCDPLEVHLDQFEIGTSSPGGIGATGSDCASGSGCGEYHGSPGGSPADPVLFVIHGIVITEV